VAIARLLARNMAGAGKKVTLWRVAKRGRTLLAQSTDAGVLQYVR
jgi:hypothetical protein